MRDVLICVLLCGRTQRCIVPSHTDASWRPRGRAYLCGDGKLHGGIAEGHILARMHAVKIVCERCPQLLHSALTVPLHLQMAAVP